MSLKKRGANPGASRRANSPHAIDTQSLSTYFARPNLQRQANSQATTQPRSQATKQPSNQATKQSSNQATKQPSNQTSKQRSNQATKQPSKQAGKQPRNQGTKQASNQGTKEPSKQASNQASNQASRQATKEPSNQASKQAIKQAHEQTNKNSTQTNKQTADCNIELMHQNLSLLLFVPVGLGQKGIPPTSLPPPSLSHPSSRPRASEAVTSIRTVRALGAEEHTLDILTTALQAPKSRCISVWANLKSGHGPQILVHVFFFFFPGQAVLGTWYSFSTHSHVASKASVIRLRKPRGLVLLFAGFPCGQPHPLPLYERTTKTHGCPVFDMVAAGIMGFWPPRLGLAKSEGGCFASTYRFEGMMGPSDAKSRDSPTQKPGTHEPFS